MQDTFVIAADRLQQLRDPDKLRPWLYAVARSVAMGHLRDRKRERAEADLDDIVDVTDGPHEVAHRAELQDLVWEAARGLSDRDRMVMDLHLRQGLEGRDLAMAMDVTENNANVMLSRVRDRVERSLGAFLVARLGSEHCEQLQALLRNWDGRFTPLVRKRVARHVDECDACDARRRAVASPWALLGTVPLIPAPAALRDRVLERIELTSAGRTRPGTRGPAAKAAAVIVAALVGAAGIVAGATALRGRAADAPAVAALAEGADDPTVLALDDATEVAAEDGLRLSPEVLHLAAGDSGSLSMRNVGAQPLAWTATATRPWLGLDRSEGTIAPGALTRITVRAGGAARQGATATVTVAYGGDTVSADVEVSAVSDPGSAPAQDPAAAPGDGAAEDRVADPAAPGAARPPATADRQPSSEPAPDDPRPPAGGPDDPPTREPQPPDEPDPVRPDPTPPPDPQEPEPDPLDPQRPAGRDGPIDRLLRSDAIPLL
jgi:RNA polymerase sigma factor (sigma-70 family)